MPRSNWEPDEISRRVAALRSSADDDDLRPDPDAVVEVHHVTVGHADAARRDGRADGVGLVRAMDPVEARAEVERAGAERILHTAWHVAREVWAAAQHLRRRAPVRPFALHCHRLGAGPREPLPPDADAVADRLSSPEHEV